MAELARIFSGATFSRVLPWKHYSASHSLYNDASRSCSAGKGNPMAMAMTIGDWRLAMTLLPTQHQSLKRPHSSGKRQVGYTAPTTPTACEQKKFNLDMQSCIAYLGIHRSRFSAIERHRTARTGEYAESTQIDTTFLITFPTSQSQNSIHTCIVVDYLIVCFLT